MCKKIEKLKELEFNSTTELIKYLNDNQYIYKVDKNSTGDIYFLEKGEHRDNSYLFQLNEKPNGLLHLTYNDQKNVEVL